MPYEILRQGARMALLCLEPGKAHSAEEVHKRIKAAYAVDDPRTGIHLEHLVFIGLAEKRALGNDRVGYEITELGVRACNQLIKVQKKQLDIVL